MKNKIEIKALKLLCLVVALLSSTLVWAADSSLEGVGVLNLVVGDAKIDLFSVKSGAGQVQWTGQGEAFYQIERAENELTLSSKMDKSTPITIKIFTSQDKKIKVNGFDIDMTVTGYVGSLQIAARQLNGQFRMGKGSLSINSPKGGFSIMNQTGDIDIETYSASAVVKDSTGQLDLFNFSGDINIDHQMGRIRVKQYSGGAKVANSEGSFNGDLGRSSLGLSQHKGRVDLDSKEGQLNIGVLGDPEVDVRAKSGKIVVSLENGNVWLNLQTVSGDLYGPSEIKPYRVGHYKYLRGRTPGTGKGQVSVRSEDAAIIVK